jgi:hypothetical protein
MWSVNGTFNGQLQILLDNSLDVVNCLAVDSANHTMYVGCIYTLPVELRVKQA